MSARASWASLVASYAAQDGPQRARARALAAASGRPVETCLTALRRYRPGKAPRKLTICARCAQIRRILSEQQP